MWVVVVNQADPSPLIELLANPKRVTLAHNANFEYRFTLARYGVRLGRPYCSKLAEQVLTAGLDQSASLDDTVERRLGVVLDKSQQKTFIGADPDTFFPTPEQVEYAAQDVRLLPDLRRVQVEAIKAEGLVPTLTLELSVLPVFAEMELRGLRLDAAKHREVLSTYEADVEHYGVQAAAVLDPFWQAVAARKHAQATQRYAELGEQLQRVLEPHGGRLSKETPEDVWQHVLELRKERHKPKPVATIRLTAREEVLAALAESGIQLPNLQKETVEANVGRSPVLTAYAKWAKANKVVSTYGQSLVSLIHPVTGRIHPSFNQVVSTGRVSSSEPNAQNMPPKIRACFVPADGYRFVVADFANMELRIFAGLSGDPTMLDAFAAGKDLHRMTAAAAWPDKYPDGWESVPKDSQDRADGKTANFASIYGGSANAMYYRGLVADLQIAERLVDGITRTYDVGWAWINQQGNDALHTGFALTALGRKRFFPRLPPSPNGYAAQRDWKRLQGGIRRAAMNHPVQGTGADIAKRAMRLIYERLGGRGYVVNAVHDEIVVEARAADAEAVAAMVADAMKEAGSELIRGVPIPADVHIVDAWTK